MNNGSTPRALGYRWPAEWERHLATWLSWPHNPDTWPSAFPQAVQQYVALVETIARYEPVHILAGGNRVMREARDRVGHVRNVTLHDVPTNDAWIRDHGPTFLSSSSNRPLQPALVDWQYNAWGQKYPPFDADNAVPERVAAIAGRRRFVVDMVLEGGSIEGNGASLVLTTGSCLLNPNRNPGLPQDRVEQYLRDYLAADSIVWLQGEIPGDDTDGHIDQIARFVARDSVVATVDPRARPGSGFDSNIKLLERFQMPGGSRLQVVPLPLPSPQEFNGMRLPASYANFYILNGAVIVPAFSDPMDERAVGILREFFPDREVISLSAAWLIVGLGAFHCLTQQEPLATCEL
jgi:agmatine deiminase